MLRSTDQASVPSDPGLRHLHEGSLQDRIELRVI